MQLPKCPSSLVRVPFSTICARPRTQHSAVIFRMPTTELVPSNTQQVLRKATLKNRLAKRTQYNGRHLRLADAQSRQDLRYSDGSYFVFNERRTLSFVPV